jgi:hypothetical protein
VAAGGGGGGGGGSWCVASPSASTAALQVALDYACGQGGVDCGLLRHPVRRRLLQPQHRSRPRVVRLQQLLPEEPRPDQLRLRRHRHPHQHRSQ